MKQKQEGILKIVLAPLQVNLLKSLSLTPGELFEKIEEERAKNPSLNVEKKQTNSSFIPSSNGLDSLENIGKTDRQKSLKEYLFLQIEGLDFSEREFIIASNLIKNLDDRGYNKKDPYSIFKNVSKVELKSVLNRLYILDPEGCFMSDPKEKIAFLIKLKEEEEGEDFALLKSIVENNFDLLIKMNIKKLSLIYGLSREELEIELKKLKGIDLNFQHEENDNNIYILPEVEVKNDADELKIKTFFDDLPYLRVTENGFDKKLVNDAIAFLNMLDKLKTSFNMVVSFVISFQKDFFYFGTKSIKPLLIKDVALHLKINSSTVSRLLKNRYFRCDFGVFPFKILFSNSILPIGNGTKTHSKAYVKEIIKDIISETPQISCQKISLLLKKRGIKLERRTVLKYKNELN